MTDKRFQPVWVFAITLISIFFAEFGIMLNLDYFARELSGANHALLDSILLVAVLFPILYGFIFYPLMEKSKMAGERAEKESEARKESEEQFKRIAENAPDIILRWNAVSGIEYANPALEQITGYAPDEVVGKMGFLASKIHPDDIQAFIETLQSMGTKGERAKAAEFRLFAKDGSVVCLDARFVPLWNDKGEILTAEIIARTITGRKRAEESLRERERLLSESQKLAHVGSWEVDLKTHVARWTDELYRIHGYEPGEITPSYEFFLSTVHSDDRDDVYRMTQGAIVDGNPFEGQFRIVRPDGSMRWLHAVSALLKDEKGSPCRLWGAAQDITERVKADDEMASLSNVVEQTADLIIITNIDGVIEYVNPAFEKLTGYAKNEVLGKTPVILKSGEHDNAFYENFWNKILSGEVYSGEFVNKKKNGETYTVDKTVTPIRNDEGKITHFVAVDKDVTERKHEEENQEKITRLESLGVLAGGIAHDFNNLLTAILGNVSFAKLSISSQSRTYGLLDEAEKASLRAKELARQLLTFSKGGEPVKVIVSVAALVKEAACFALRGSRIRCTCSIPEELWLCNVDEGQITQVVQNIVLNAEQAMPERGRIFVWCENVPLQGDDMAPLKEGDYVRVSVQDEGGGIPPEHLKRIFEPYFTTKKKGSGLGLATSYSIVKKHGGHIFVESETGQGTVFHIYLPACKEAPAQSMREEKILPVGNGKILVMDDEAPIRMLLQGMLEFLRYEAAFAKDGKEALSLYAAGRENGKPFDAVLLDLTIPGGMGGKETMQKLLEMNLSVKAIVSSGYSEDPVMANYKQHGFKAVIQKPYDLKKMGEVLHDVMGKNGNSES